MIPNQEEKDEVWLVHSMWMSMFLVSFFTSIIYFVLALSSFFKNDFAFSDNFTNFKYILMALLVTWPFNPILFVSYVYYFCKYERSEKLISEDKKFKVILYMQIAILLLTASFGFLLYNTPQCPPNNFPEEKFSKYITIATNLQDVGSATTICCCINLFLIIVMVSFFG